MPRRVFVSTAAMALQQGQMAQQRLKEQQFQVYDQGGKTTIVNTGTKSETIFQLSFVHVFMEEPLFTYGFALDGGAPESGSYPTCSLFVVNWLTEGVAPIYAYVGARLGAYTTGSTGMRFVLHYNFKGRATSFPTDNSPVNGTGNA